MEDEKAIKSRATISFVTVGEHDSGAIDNSVNADLADAEAEHNKLLLVVLFDFTHLLIVLIILNLFFNVFQSFFVTKENANIAKNDAKIYQVVIDEPYTIGN